MAKYQKAIGVSKPVMGSAGTGSFLVGPRNKIREAADGLLASEGRMATSDPQELQFFDAPYQRVDATNSTGIRDDIKMAIKYYRNDSLVGRTIDFMVTLANEGFRNECEDEDTKQWFDQWCLDVKMDRVLTWVFMEYFRSANAVIARTLIDYKAADGRQTTRKGKVPGVYRVLNPLSVDVSEGSFFGSEELWLMINDNTRLMQSLKATAGRKTFSEKDKYLAQLIDFGTPMHDQKVRLKNENVKRVLRLAQSYELYGTPMLKRCARDLFLKQKLKEMDLSTINGVISSIIMVTMGDETHPATANKLQKAAKIFQNSSKTKTIVWDHTLKIEVVRPGDPTWLNAEKYESVNQSVREAFGISGTLSGGGTSGGQNDGYLALKGFIGNLIDARKAASDWLYEEYKYIQSQLKFKEIPRPVFTPLGFGDEIREKQVISNLADKGIVSYRSAQEMLGFNPDTEVSRKRKEKDLVEEGLYKSPGGTGGAAGLNGRPGGSQTGNYPPDRKAPVAKRLKGKAEALDSDTLYEVTGAELQEAGIQNTEQLWKFLEHETKKSVEQKIERISGGVQ